MLDKLGKRRYAMPIVAIIIVFCVLATMMYPMLNAAPKNVPFALLNLDAGANLPTGSVNMGDEVAKKMQEGGALQEGAESPLVWTELDSKAALDAAFENNEFYGAIIIPEDFTSTQMAAMLAASSAMNPDVAAADAAGTKPGDTATTGVEPDAAANAADASTAADPAGTAPNAAAQNTSAQAPSTPTIQVIINQGKNVMLATTMQTALTTMLGQTGLNVEVTTINAADTGGGSMASLMSGMIMVMPTFILSAICSVLICLLFRPTQHAGKGERVKALGKQLVYAAAASALVACAAVLIVTWVGGMTLPAASIFMFLWLGSFCLMALFIGALDIALPLGALTIAACFAFGMGTAMLAYEMLPVFWQDWVYPWAPQYFISNGVASIIYMGKTAWNTSSLPLAITGCIGLGLMLVALILPAKKDKLA